MRLSGVGLPALGGLTADELTRRRLLEVGGLAAAAIAFAPAFNLATRFAAVATASGPAAGLAVIAAPAHLRRSSFTGLVGQQFELRSAGRRAPTTLVAVEDLGIGPAMQSLAGRDDAFALVFHDPGSRRLEQDVVRIDHAGLGRFDLLVSPASASHYYAAVINRAPIPRRSGGTHVRAVPR